MKNPSDFMYSEFLFFGFSPRIPGKDGSNFDVRIFFIHGLKLNHHRLTRKTLRLVEVDGLVARSVLGGRWSWVSPLGNILWPVKAC